MAAVEDILVCDSTNTGTRRLLCGVCVMMLMASHAAAAPKEPALCEQGQRQSPIDITATRMLDLPALTFDYQPAPLRLVNDGHTVRLRFSNANRLRVGKERYTLTQVHFHTPGGDRVHGEDFPFAAHLLHRGADGRLLALVVLFRLGVANAWLERFWSEIPPQANGEQVHAGIRINAADLLPATRGHYRYEGSLTGPPCTEGVDWIVLKQPLELSQDQLAHFRKLFGANIRGPQPLHGRTVLESR